jgi:uncharacterized protein YdcH (DUF465 family)
MFPEHRERISQLKSTNGHFARLVDEHDALDQRIARMVSFAEPGTPLEIEQLKKKKLRLKDEVGALLKQAPAS